MSGGIPSGLGSGWVPSHSGSVGDTYIDHAGYLWVHDGWSWMPQGRATFNNIASSPVAVSSLSAVHMPPITSHQLTQMAQAMQTPGLISKATVHTSLLHKLTRPDPKAPDTLGWRAWLWNSEYKCLQSPVQDTLWHSAVLSAESWSKYDSVRNNEGIHALLVRKHWKLIGWQGGYVHGPCLVHGIVERFGRYVLGTEGWRAEQVKILELMAPSTEIGLQLEQKYPGVIIHYPDQEEDEEWTLEKSSRSAKGKRSLLPNPSASPSTSPASPSPPPPDLLQSASLPSTKKKGSPLNIGVATMFGALAGWFGVLAVLRIVHGG